MPPFLLVSIGAVLVVVTTDRIRLIERIVRRAITDADMTFDQAAQEAEVDRAQFARQLKCEEGTLRRLVAQPDAFWQWLAVEIVDEFGIPALAERAIRIRLACLGRRRVVRAAMAQKVKVS